MRKRHGQPRAEEPRAEGIPDGVETDATTGAALTLRRGRFEDVAAMLALIEGAVAQGCRDHYGAAQRHAVYVSYARSAFVDALEPFETVIAEIDGDLAAFAQLDPETGRLRALFVGAELQGLGIGATVLAHVLKRAEVLGCARVHGAMSLNAVPFYERAGFRPCSGREQLTVDGVSVPVAPMERPAARRRRRGLAAPATGAK